jgi:hypothetical protein
VKTASFGRIREISETEARQPGGLTKDPTVVKLKEEVSAAAAIAMKSEMR